MGSDLLAFPVLSGPDLGRAGTIDSAPEERQPTTKGKLAT